MICSHTRKHSIAAMLLTLSGIAACQIAPDSIQSGSSSNDCSIGLSDPLDMLTGPAGTIRTRGELEAFIEERMTDLKVPGSSVAIIEDGALAFHYASGVANVETGEPVTSCTLFQGASITKPMFGQFVMTFVEDGVLDLDRPLYEYLPYAAIEDDERYKRITARMALTHQSGFPNWRTDFPDNKLFIQFDPGAGFSYSGEAYQYLALVLQEIAGVDAAGLETLFQERIARPAGQYQTQIVPDEDILARTARPHKAGRLIQSGSAHLYSDFGSAYGVHSEARDFSKWLISLLNEEGLSTGGFEAYFEPQGVPLPEDSSQRQSGLVDYALGFAIFEAPFGDVYAHGGNNPGYTSFIVLDRAHRWGVVIFTNNNQANTFWLDLILFLGLPPE